MFRIYTEKQFQDNFDNVEMNKRLKFLAPAHERNTYKIRDGVHLQLVNNSTEKILFTIDSDTVIMYYDFDSFTWKEIENQVEHIDISGNDTQFIQTFQPEKPALPIWIKPRFDPSIKKVTLRVVATGEIYQDGTPTGKLTGAYIDLTLYK